MGHRADAAGAHRDHPNAVRGETLAEGVRIAGRAPTPEDVAANIDRIADVSASRVFRTSGEEVAAVVGS